MRQSQIGIEPTSHQMGEVSLMATNSQLEHDKLGLEIQKQGQILSSSVKYG